MVIAIFRHALRMVFYDLGAALRVSSPVILVALLATIGLFSVNAGPDHGMFVPPLLMIVCVLAYFAAVLWSAVAWHRYALLSEYPSGLIPAFRGDRIVAYLFMTILIVLMTSGAVIVGGLVIRVIAAVASVLGTFLGLAGFVALLVVVQRIGIVLPAAAIGTALGFDGAWEATRPYKWTLLGVLTLTIVFGLIIGVVVSALTLLWPPLGVAANLVASWLQMLVTLSVLTTVYGVAVEGRSLD